MKLVSMMVFALAFMASLHAQETPTQFMQRWVKAYNGNQGEVMANFYDRSQETDCLVSAGVWLRGFDEIRSMYRGDMKAVRFYDSQAEQMRHRLLDDHTALVSFIHKFKYEIRDSGEHCRVHIRTTVTLHLVDKAWRIVSEHSSAIQGVDRVVFIEAERKRPEIDPFADGEP